MNTKQLEMSYKGWQFSFDLNSQKTHNAFLGALARALPDIPKLHEIDAAIETGTHDGKTTGFLAHYFAEVQTVELEVTPQRKSIYQRMAEVHPHIHFHTGDSAKVLREILEDQPDRRFVIILDAHNGYNTPLREELAAIRECSNVKNHVILIDDTDDAGQGTWPSHAEIGTLLQQINPTYQVINPKIARGTVVAVTK